MTLPRRPKSLLLLLLLGLVGGGGVDGADAFKPITYHHCKAPGASTAIAIMNVTGRSAC